MFRKLLLLITPFILLSFIPISSFAAKPVIKGKIIFMKGKAELVRSSRKYNLKYGFRVIERDTVVTRRNALVVVKLTTGDTLKVRQNSRVTITLVSVKNKKSRIHLHSGGLMAKVKRLKGRKFQVNTPVSVAGVRGTTFYVESSETYERDKMAVKKGQIEITNNANNSTTNVSSDEGIEFGAKEKVGKPKRLKWVQKLNWAVNPLNWEMAKLPSMTTNYGRMNR